MPTVFVATVTDTDDNDTSVIGVFSSRELAKQGCQRYLDGTLDPDDQEVLDWNAEGTYAGVDMFDFGIEEMEIQ